MKKNCLIFAVLLLAFAPLGCSQHGSSLGGDAVYSKAGFDAVKTAKETPQAEASAIQKMRDSWAKAHPNSATAPVSGPTAH